MREIEEKLKTIFNTLNYSDEDLKIYLYLIVNGATPVQTISNKTGIARSTCYNILDRLSWQGIVSITKIGETVNYKAEDPKVLVEILNKKAKSNKIALDSINEIIPDLTSFYSRTNAQNTDTRYYYGNENMKKVLFKMLEESKGTEVLSTCHGVITKGKDLMDDPQYLLEYFKKLKEVGITERGILEDIKPNRQYIKEYSGPTSKYKLSPKLNDLDTAHIDKYVFNNKVLILNFEGDYAVYIDDAYIAKNERILFEIMWESLK